MDPFVSSAPRDGLVGRCPLVEIKVNGVSVRCLVDTGSQVTLFSESLSKDLFDAHHLPGAEVPWLTLRGANGLNIPYIGYQVTDLEIHGTTIPQKGVVIVRDSCLGEYRALLGMNVLMDCWEELFRAGPPRPTSVAEKREWERVVTVCRRVRVASSQPDREDVGRVACRYAVSIPAQSEAVVWVRLPERAYSPEECVLVEPHWECQTVEVARGLTVARRGRVTVKVRNPNTYPVHLYRHQRLTRITPVDPHQVREEQEVRFCQVSATVVEVGLAEKESRPGPTAQGMPGHLQSESLEGEGLTKEQTCKLQMTEAPATTTEWVYGHHRQLHSAYEKVSKHLDVAAKKNKRLYDRTAREAPLLPGERVLVRDNRRQGKGKLSDRWETVPYVVEQRQRPDQPVYTIRPEGKTGPVRILHRNLLRPCPNYPRQATEAPPAPVAPAPPWVGWAVFPRAPTPEPREEEPAAPARRSQRETRGVPPTRYGEWESGPRSRD
ncbi:hypothetical protein G5714_020365 [Onychostoma macrolepis]|uniref:Uncharacterized protein n=1 Tax=Onychostoma macrolepis TaxID=369639 RepID=A0A7J6BVK3_9TELE|nr:hypothetical protein G5714_020365 [Onychostoma macrolepis]